MSHPADGEGRPANQADAGLIASILVGLTVISGCSLGGLSSEIKQAGAPATVRAIAKPPAASCGSTAGNRYLGDRWRIPGTLRQPSGQWE